MTGTKLEDFTAWRLKVKGTSIPVRVISNAGTADAVQGSITQVVIIRGAELESLLDYIFPSYSVAANGRPVYKYPLKYGDIGPSDESSLYYLVGQQDKVQLYAQECSWRALVPGKPVDPYLTDPGVNMVEGAYDEYLELTIVYKPIPPNADKFLTVSARASGEFIHTTSPSSTYESESPGGQDEENKDPYLPNVITVPTTEWTITWHRLPRSVWNTYVYRDIQKRLGKVNSTAMKQLFDAPAETILFTGYTFRDDYTWRSYESTAAPSVSEILPCTVEFMFREKHMRNTSEEDATVHGHNSVYRPEAAEWRKVKIGADDKPLYKKTNLNSLFFWATGEDDPDNN